MQPGEVTGLEAFGHVFLMRLEAKQNSAIAFERGSGGGTREYRQERGSQMEKELLVEVKEQIALADTDRFVDYCLERMYRQVHDAAPAASSGGVSAQPGPAGSSE
jgi:hypothetical protein